MIDVSSYQGRIDWARVHAAGVRHAYIKLLEFGVDPMALRNIKEARQAGVTIGFYFFAHPSESPVSAARRFLAQADGHLQTGDLPPALDLEIAEGHGWPFLNDWKAQWFAIVDAHVGVRSVFYSYYYFWKQMHLYPDRPVWGAATGHGFTPPASWAMHQYSFAGHVDGVQGPVDLSKILHDVPVIK